MCEGEFDGLWCGLSAGNAMHEMMLEKRRWKMQVCKTRVQEKEEENKKMRKKS